MGTHGTTANPGAGSFTVQVVDLLTTTRFAIDPFQHTHVPPLMVELGAVVSSVWAK